MSTYLRRSQYGLELTDFSCRDCMQMLVSSCFGSEEQAAGGEDDGPWPRPLCHGPEEHLWNGWWMALNRRRTRLRPTRYCNATETLPRKAVTENVTLLGVLIVLSTRGFKSTRAEWRRHKVVDETGSNICNVSRVIVNHLSR